jgi:hypothetical protein
MSQSGAHSHDPLAYPGEARHSIAFRITLSMWADLPPV